MRRKYLWWIFAGVVVIWSFVRLYSYAGTISAPFAWDQSAHLIISKIVDNYFDQGKYLDGLRYYRFYPPLAHTTYVPFIDVMGISRESVTAHMFVWLLVLFFGIKILSLRVLPTVHQILLVVCCLTLFSSRGIYVWEPMLEIPLTISLILFYLLINRFIFLKHYSFFSALAVAIATSIVLQIKGSGIPYLIMPLLLYWYWMSKKYKWITIWYFLLFSGVVFLLNDWYWVNLDQHLNDAWFINVFTGLNVKQDPQSWQGAMMYATMIVQGLGILMIVPLAFIGKFLVNIKQFKPKLNTPFLLFLSQAVTFFVLVISPNKDYRYVFTWLVLSIVIMILMSARILSNKLIVGLIIIVSLILCYRIDFELAPADRRVFAYNELPRLIKKYDISHLNYFFEDDSPWFNYANLELLNLTTLPLPYTMLNRNSVDALIDKSGYCEISLESRYILVYSYLTFWQNKPAYHVPFSDYCTNIDASSVCDVVEIFEPNDDESLTIYECELAVM
jgi:hypothetical protein